jgi:glucose/arabinose dehydrogenase
MFATDNGPDADAPEELNLIEKGKHYGFPYQFSDWTNKPYAYTPDPSPGLQFTKPIANLGPAGGFSDKPLYTFDPHSSPAGIVYLGNDFPPDFRGTLLVTRFGNLIKKPKDVGFDLLQVRLEGGKRESAKISSVLSPLGRPLDVHLAGNGRIYILEYTRQIDNKSELPMLPGRILELAVKR